MEGSALSRAGSQLVLNSQPLLNSKAADAYGTVGKNSDLKIDTSPPQLQHRTIDLTSTSHLHKISVKDMVRITMKSGDVFGIEGYNLPRNDFPVHRGTQNKFPVEKNKNFADIQSNYTKGCPGPGTHDVTYKWGCVSKNVKPTAKNTYIDQIVKNQTGKPSPQNYTINYSKVDPGVQKSIFGAKLNAPSANYLSEIEFLGNQSPSGNDYEKSGDAKDKLLKRCTSVISFQHQKKKDQDWKVKKIDGPGPGGYEGFQKGFDKTHTSSPEVKIKKAKRIIFAEAASIQKKDIPSPVHYQLSKDTNYNKLWKRVEKKRH